MSLKTGLLSLLFATTYASPVISSTNQPLPIVPGQLKDIEQTNNSHSQLDPDDLPSSIQARKGKTGMFFEKNAPTVNWFDLMDALQEMTTYLGDDAKTYWRTWWPGGLAVNNIALSAEVGNAVVYICDYGTNGVRINERQLMDDIIQLLGPGFQQNAGQEDWIRASWYSHPEWAMSNGFTAKGRNFCN